MSSRDLHAALKTEVVNTADGGGVPFLVVRLQNSREDVSFSLHAAPNSHSTAGIQTTDFLNYLGFVRGHCAFVNGDCYSRAILENFDLPAFAIAFANAYQVLDKAERALDKCGFFLPQPEGWGYFYGKPSEQRGERFNIFASGGGNGHTAPKSELLKTAEDEYFDFALAFLSGGSSYEKGWVFHYHPKHSPVSPEIRSALGFLNLKNFEQCPFFDFAHCYWRFTQFEANEDEIFSRKTHFVHESFSAHAEQFSKGIEKLLEAQRIMRPFGMSFIPVPREVASNSSKQLAEPHSKGGSKARKYKYDVAISFAGTERTLAERLATLARDQGFEIFYDNFYPEELWGKDLVFFFDDIYRKQSHYCVIFVSAQYSSRMWTNYERRSAQARMLEERGGEYILPIQVDESELAGMPPTLGHLSLKEHTIEQIADLLIKKLQSPE